MWEIFQSEAQEKLQELEEALLDIENHGPQAESISSMYRAIHTFKGNSRIMGLSNLENLAHQAEDLMGMVRDHNLPFDQALAQIFFQVLDAFRYLVDQVVEAQGDIEAEQISALYSALQNAVIHYRDALKNDSSEADNTRISQEEKATANEAEMDLNFLDIYLEMIEQDKTKLNTAIEDLQEGDDSAYERIEEQLEAWLHATENLELETALNALHAADSAFHQGDFPRFAEALHHFYAALEQSQQSPEPVHNESEPESSAVSDAPRADLDNTDLDNAQAENFFKQVETELLLVGEGLQHLTLGEEAETSLIFEALESLIQVCQQHHFVSLQSVLEMLHAAFSPGPQEGEEALLKALEYSFFSELNAIHESLSQRYPDQELYAEGFLLVFQQWHAHQMIRILSLMRQSLQNPEATANWHQKIAKYLKQIHPACCFYQLDEAAELCLILEDLYFRKGDQNPSALLQQQTIALCDVLLKTLEDPESVAENAFTTLIQKVRQGDGIQEQSQNWADKLKLNPAFLEVLNQENLQHIENAYQNHLHFYLIQANLNTHPELSSAFYHWLEDDLIQNISNITLYQGNRSEFQFLIASLLTLQEVNAGLASFDTQRRILVKEIPLEKQEMSSTTNTPNTAKAEVSDVSEVFQNNALQNTQRSNSNVLKVDINKVNRLMDLAGEIGLAAGAVLTHPELKDLNLTGFQIQAQNLMNLIRELQGETSSLRLVPVSVVFKRMERLVRDLKHSTNKDIELILLGETTEIDKMMVDKLYDPLVHMIRNAVDHGIEAPEEREKLGKPRTGRLVLNAMHQAGEVVISLHDDGRGLDRKAIVNRAVENGLIEADVELDDAAIFDLIFQPGFSTSRL